MADKGCALLPLCPDPSPFQMAAVPGSVLSIPPHQDTEGRRDRQGSGPLGSTKELLC